MSKSSVLTRPYKVMYHAFTWANDATNHFTDDYGEALAKYHEYKNAHDSGARLYEEIFQTRNDYINGESTDENCLLSQDD